MARKKNEVPVLSVVTNPPVALVEAAPRSELRLDLGSGQRTKEGFEGVDLHGDAKHRVNLWKFPWPFADNSVTEIHCSHFLEHIPSREVEERDITTSLKESERKAAVARYVGVDMLCAFMDECWRILKPDAWMTAIVPSARSNRAFQDPTHRRYFVQESFLYFNRDWRQMNGLDHGYLGKCNFGVEVPYSLPSEEGLRAPEVQSRRFHECWNVTIDWHAKLKKLL